MASKEELDRKILEAKLKNKGKKASEIVKEKRIAAMENHADKAGRGESVKEIPLSKIVTDRPFQVRAELYTDEKMENLIASIKKSGMKEPVILRPAPARTGFYEVIDGHHRLDAHIKMKAETIKAFIRNLTDAEASDTAEQINIHKSDLSPRDLYGLIVSRVTVKKLSYGQIAKELCINPKTIQRYIRVHSTPDVRDWFEKGQINIKETEELFKMSETARASYMKTKNEPLKERKESIKDKRVKKVVPFIIDEEKKKFKVNTINGSFEDIKDAVKTMENIIKELKKHVD